MSRYIEKVENMTLPALPMRGLVIFPGVPTSFEINNKRSVAAMKAAAMYGGNIFLACVRNADKPTEKPEMYSMGVVARLKQSLKLPDGNYRLLVEAKQRAEIVETVREEEYPTVNVLVKSVYLPDDGGLKGQALVAEALDAFQSYIKFMPKISTEVVASVQAITDPGLLSDFIAANVLFRYEDKQQVLEECDPLKRLERLIVILEQEREVLSLRNDLHDKVKERLSDNQREYFLKEQLKVIHDELGMTGDADEDGFFERIEKSAFSDEIKERLAKEANKLGKMPFGSSESSVIRNFLETILELPVGVYTKDVFDVQKARKILDEDHNGMQKVKERILEYIAVKQLSPDLRGQVICLVGPPGVGKSSIASSIARAMGRNFVRISLGGVRDEADIRGHRKTYIGAMPGRIAEGMTRAKSMNPVVLLDEIDKLSRDAHGDPASALLEALDSEQNKTFRDHFLEIPLDISNCIFIATANNAETIPDALYDRMEVINLPSYTRNEKLAICKDHLLPKQLKRHGLTKRNLKLSDDAIFELIDGYTKEAGVRNLEREVASLIRKIAMKIATGEKKSFSVSAKVIPELMGPRKSKPDPMLSENTVGVVNGLAWTALGGEMLQIEVLALQGTGKFVLTGSLGDVMKESAQAAESYIRKHREELGIKNAEFYKDTDLHIHVPEGAIPKDGPSAGITMVSAIVSALSGRKARYDVAMTGEVTLTGRVLPIGGLREKTMAAYKNGMKAVLIPYDNISDLHEVDPIVKEAITFIPVKHVSEVLEVVLEPISESVEDEQNTEIFAHGENVVAVCHNATV
ncbi:MAG: endopeptidase La [Clostridia bacterium]|nr:endopeptidase La [Clostridia bacterium]